MFIFYILFWIVFSFVVGSIGDKRKIGFFWSFFVALIFSPIIGLIIALISDKKMYNTNNTNNQKHSFEEYLEKGKKSEYKGNYETAIDNYMDALYHLDNDYDELDDNDKIEIEEIKTEIKCRIKNIQDL